MKNINYDINLPDTFCKSAELFPHNFDQNLSSATVYDTAYIVFPLLHLLL